MNSRVKTIYTLLCMLCTSAALAQQLYTPAPGSYQESRNSVLKAADRSVIWSCDFANGIPSDWINGEAGGIAQWEYRGPSTSPSNETGGRGSCVITGINDQPINSPTAGNGFVIFDSNWWDNSSNPCSPDFFGTGAAPGPHVATLETPSIDLSSHNFVALMFNQYLNRYQGEVRIEISADGGEWISVYSNPDLPLSTTDDQQFIQISAVAGGHADVKLRFVFDAMYYFWQLDDISIIETAANDLAILQSTYGDFDINDSSHPTGFEFLEYSKYPDEIPPNLKFSSQCLNMGGVAQENCRLNVEVKNIITGDVIHTAQSDEGIFILPGATAELMVNDHQMSAVQGNYKIAYASSQNAADESTQNNHDTLLFIIDDVQYARDRFFTSALYFPSDGYTTQQYEVGNIFLVPADGLSCHSITVAVGAGTVTPCSIYGALYSFSIETGLSATLIATTPEISVTADMINGFGEQHLANLTFDSPVSLAAGTSYFAAVGCVNGADNFICAMSGVAEDFSAWAKFFPNEWFYVNRIPIVRMNFGFFDGISNAIQLGARSISIFPNPAKDEVTLEVEEWSHESFEISIMDMAGKIVLRKNIGNDHAGRIAVNVSELTCGPYEVSIASGKKRGHTRFLKME